MFRWIDPEISISLHEARTKSNKGESQRMQALRLVFVSAL
jgi:hypothetical protein